MLQLMCHTSVHCHESSVGTKECENVSSQPCLKSVCAQVPANESVRRRQNVRRTAAEEESPNWTGERQTATLVECDRMLQIRQTLPDHAYLDWHVSGQQS
jgi:hypothetical protein